MKYPHVFASLLVLLPWLVATACAAASEVQVPLTVKWNIAQKDSVVEQDFVITKDWWYRFDIQFHSTRQDIDPVTRTEQMKKFIGDGSHGFVTKESANTDHPIWFNPHTMEDHLQLQEGLRQGTYVRKSGDPGVIVPVHLRIDQLDGSGATTAHTDKIVETENFYSAGSGGLYREIAIIHLKPGKYRVKVTTTRNSALPPNIETSLSVVRDIR